MLIRRLAQPMIASTFIAQGLDAVRHPDKHVDLAKDKVDRVTTAAGLGAISPTQLGLVVRAHGALTVLLGLKVALGKNRAAQPPSSHSPTRPSSASTCPNPPPKPKTQRFLDPSSPVSPH